MRYASIIAALVVALATPAHADDAQPAAKDAKPDATIKKPRKVLPPYVPGKPDQWAVEGAEEANLVGTGIRSGFMFAVALAPALQIGIRGIENATGTGGGFSFRIGRFANRDTIIMLELCGTVFPHRFTIAGDPVTHTRYQQSTLATVGAQTYVAPSFWIRGAVGFASFTSRIEVATADPTVNSFGVGSVLGAGVDVIRRKSLALAVELLTTGAIYPRSGGMILGGGLGLSFGVY